MATDTEIAWCAGFFDGEGHISCHRTYPHAVTGKVSALLQCSIAQAASNIEVLEEFQRIVGYGKIKGPYKMPNGKPQYRLIFGVNEVESLFLLIKPYLKTEKSDDFRLALMKYWTHDSKATSDDYDRLRRKIEKKTRKEVKHG